MTRVLVIEDSRTQAVQLERILATDGFSVEVASDGVEGLARCAAGGVDLVLSDIVMPGLSGYDVCRRLKANPDTRRLPVILLTTLNDPSDIVEALECGAENFITKPYEADYLLARVRTVLATQEIQARPGEGAETEMVVMGRRVTISSEKEQILGLLMSSFEDTIRVNRELQRSQAALEEAAQELRARSEQLALVNKELEAYVYTVSHDLKEPLRGIEAFSEIVVSEHAGGVDQEGRRYLDIVRTSAAHMRQLIDDLLAFSRVGREHTPAVVVDLATVVREALGLLRFTLDEAGATVDVPADLPTIIGQPVLLQQLFANLLGNAIKYRRPGVAPRITVAWRHQVGAIELAIADNGIGIAPEHRERVFGLFQRLHARHDYAGTGVGLAICKRIVEVHEGTIAVEETAGGGCTLRLTLAGRPRAEEARRT